MKDLLYIYIERGREILCKLILLIGKFYIYIYTYIKKKYTDIHIYMVLYYEICIEDYYCRYYIIGKKNYYHHITIIIIIVSIHYYRYKNPIV